ncbi:FERM and PDZ domain-containing protein 2-like [Erinaceus europaeus]|uniref:FERM and PDZ domain-containing protein 2-like n=1 Tax=Erinaceus europaeus TaxID=9365 RepID=A0ABM3YA20_ERIEU|nr:FERM and PDZ domain-containing protein 2-like [Erinaceus europaeus]
MRVSQSVLNDFVYMRTGFQPSTKLLIPLSYLSLHICTVTCNLPQPVAIFTFGIVIVKLRNSMSPITGFCAGFKMEDFGDTCSIEAYSCMSPTSVTLASVLQVRGEALSEEEIWALLSLAAQRLLEDLRDDSSDYVVCPWSALLSVTGSLSFQDHSSHLEAAPFKAPELLQGQKDGEQPDASQPLQLNEPLHSVLLTMCEDQPRKRLPLVSVLETCRLHWEEVAVHPASAHLHIKRLVGSVLGTISEVERRVVEESFTVQQDRSSLLRNRLHQASCESPAAAAPECLHPCGVSERSTETQSSLGPGLSTLAHSRCSLFASRILPVEVAHDLQEGLRLSSGSGSPLSVAAENSLPATPSQREFLKRKGKFSRPEFLLLAREAPVTLHLPGSIVTKKGKSYLALRDLCVVLLSGQCLEVKCDIMSTVGAIFNAVTTFANLGEITYFGLAYMKRKYLLGSASANKYLGA